MGGSHHLQTLLQKLAAFEQLIKMEKFNLAALVADDIDGIVADFDPKIYFPKIFSTFSLLYAHYISELVACEENKGSVEWAALKELYKMDLERFVGFGGEIEFSTLQSQAGSSESASEDLETDRAEYESPDESEYDEYNEDDYD